MDYTEYHMNVREKFQIAAVSGGITILIAYLFYDSWKAGIYFPFICYIVRKQTKLAKKRKRIQLLMKQFQDTMQAVCTAVAAGMSIENAWREAEKEIRMLYGEQADMALELGVMNQSAKLRIPLEQTLLDFARRSGIEDVMSFAEVFSFAKRGGANFVHMIENTTDHMRDKFETEEEIQILVASKKYEQKIMSIVPILILAYLKLTSGEYLDILYGNWFGILFMTGCLIMYGGALVLAGKILDIKV
mgnify:CR=1 FL=1